MKFATFFTALVASATAADNQAPVISLNLVGASYVNPNLGEWYAHTHAHNLADAGNSILHTGGHPSSETNSYADTCEVTANNPSAEDACTAPTATVEDHHDGSLTVDKTYHIVIESAPGSYVASDNSANPTECPSGNTETQCLLDFSRRAEYVIEYDATDTSGNEAETVTFALIVLDSSAPVCTAGQQTPYCAPNAASTEADLHHVTHGGSCSGINVVEQNIDSVTDCSMTVELCDVQNWDETQPDLHGAISFANSNTVGFTDDYEGTVIAVTSLFSNSDFGALSKITSTDAKKIPTTEFESLTEDKDIYYEYHVEDYAGIFGRNNVNNVLRERGTLTMTDTTDPILVTVTAPEEMECGSTPLGTVSATYSDCYDSWNLASGGADALNDVEVHDATAKGGNEWFLGRSLEAAGAVTGAGAYDKTSNAPHTKAAGITTGTFDSATYSDFTLYYNVEDHFGNAATEETKNILIVDSIAPTLYITALTKDTGLLATDNETSETQTCIGTSAPYTHTEATTSDEDTTTGGCDIAELGAGSMYSHNTGIENAEHADETTFSTLLAETTIQHSAGYEADYALINDLLAEDTGYRCVDNCWNEVTTVVQWVTGSCAGVVDASSDFDMKQPGTYYLHYSCKDGSDHETTACRTFINVDHTKPVITVLQQANNADGTFILEATLDSDYVDEGATCSDIVDGTISSSVKVSGDLVDMSSPGTYTIDYDCQDAGTNDAYQAHRTVVVVDRTCPTCDMPQADAKSILTVEASFPYADATVDCTDNLDGALHGQYMTAQPTGTSYTGDLTGIDVETVSAIGYVVTYYSKDVAGNSYMNCYESPPAEGPITTEEYQDTRIYRTVVVEDSLVPTVEITYDSVVLNDRGSHPEVVMTESAGGFDYMAENRLSANGWVVGAVASAVSGVALLGYAATRKAAVATSVPV